METLGSVYEIFNKIIFFKRHFSIFQGYCNKYATVYKLVDLEEFNREAHEGLKNAPSIRFQVKVPETSKESRLKTTFKRWLTTESFSGVILGESHFECGLKSFLIKNMARLKAYRVDTIFLEFLCEEEQAALDRYLQPDQKNLTLPPEVFATTHVQDRHYGHPAGSRLVDVISAAKKHGIRIVGMESEASRSFSLDPRYGHNSNIPARTMGLNYTATRIINREKRDGKFVVLVGNSHVSALSELLGAPGLLLFDHGFFGKSEVKDGFNIQRPVKELSGTHHAVYILGKEINLEQTHDTLAFHKRMDKDATLRRLANEKPGSWLIREGTTTPGTYVLAKKQDDGDIIQQLVSDKIQLKSLIESSKLNFNLQILP